MFGAEKRTKFFDKDRDLLLCHGDVDTFVLGPALGVFNHLYKVGLFSQQEGFLRIRDLWTNKTLGTLFIGDKASWGYDYESVVERKGRLFDDAAPLSVGAQVAGGVTRYAQQIATVMLRGNHSVYYGSFYRDGVEVEFSGVQEFCDEGFATIVFTLYKMTYDLRVLQLKEVCAALDLDTYAAGMDAIEEAAEEHSYSTIDAVVRRIVDDATLIRARGIMERRGEEALSIIPGVHQHD